MNVKLVASQEVFGRHAAGSTVQPHSGYPRWITEIIGNLGTLRQPPMLKVWHTHGKTLPRQGGFLPTFIKSGSGEHVKQPGSSSALRRRGARAVWRYGPSRLLAI